MMTSCGGRVLRAGGVSVGRVVDGEADGGSLGIGITAWSDESSDGLVNAGGGNGSCAASLSSWLFMARLMMNPNATTTSTPARITDAGIRNSVNRRRPLSCNSSSGTGNGRRGTGP
jgi:hypothetical protein